MGWQQILSVLKHPDYIKQSNQHDRLFQQIDPAIEQIYGVMAKTNIFAQNSSHLLKSVNSVANVMIMAILVYNFLLHETNPLILIHSSYYHFALIF